MLNHVRQVTYDILGTKDSRDFVLHLFCDLSFYSGTLFLLAAEWTKRHAGYIAARTEPLLPVFSEHRSPLLVLDNCDFTLSSCYQRIFVQCTKFRFFILEVSNELSCSVAIEMNISTKDFLFE